MRNALIVPIVIVGVVVAAAAYLVMTKGGDGGATPNPTVKPTGAALTEQRPSGTPIPATTTPVPTPTPEEKVVAGRFSAEEDQLGVDTQVFAVEFTADGITPSEQRVKVGDIVIFRNASAQNIRPTSAGYPFAAPGVLKPGDEFQVTFTKLGTWSFSDALAPNHSGTIVVSK